MKPLPAVLALLTGASAIFVGDFELSDRRLGPRFSLGGSQPPSNGVFIQSARSTLVLSKVPHCARKTVAISPALITDRGHMLQTVVSSMPGEREKEMGCYDLEGSWCMFTYLWACPSLDALYKNEGCEARYGDKAFTIPENLTTVDVSWQWHDPSGNITQTTFTNYTNNVTSFMNSNSGKPFRFETNIECMGDCFNNGITIPEHQYANTSILLSKPDATYLASANAKATTNGYDVITLEEVWSLDDQSYHVEGINVPAIRWVTGGDVGYEWTGVDPPMDHPECANVTVGEGVTDKPEG